jgi:cytochrome oxidase assembly protein ShyY1
MQDRARQDRAVKPLVTGEVVALTGYIRFPEPAGVLTPAENPTKRLWFTRDHLAMAHALGWGEVAPFYIDLEAPVPSSGVPKPGPLEVRLKDDHMQYAITWFTLAGAVVIAFAVWVRAQRRGPGQGEMKFAPILAALRRNNYAGTISAEPFDYFPDGRSAAALSAGYLRGLREASG